MKKLLVLSILSLIIFGVSPILGREPSSTTHFYFTEYKRPVKGAEGISTLFVVFYFKMSSDQAEEFLRSEIERLIKFSPPKFDILGKAWYASGDAFTERVIHLHDGSSSLIYDIKKNKIFTSIQLWGREPPPPPFKKK